MKILLRTKLIISFLAVIIICGVVATLVGMCLIGTGIIGQAQDKVKNDLNSAREIYREETDNIKDIVRFTALRFFIKDAILDNDTEGLQQELDEIRKRESLDVLTVTDKIGRVIVRSRNPSVSGDNQAQDELVSEVLSVEKVVAGTVIVPREELIKEGLDLAEQAHIEFIPTPKAKPTLETEQTSGMMIKAAAPVFYDGSVVGVLYGGNLLNRNYEIVDRVKDTVYLGVKYKGKDIGTATIFQGDLRISTNVEGEDGSRAIGTRVSEEVYEQVLVKGLPWIDRAFVVNNWYIAAYEPVELKGRFGVEAVVGRSASMREVEELVRKVAPGDSTVLISGETGTGKELIARAIHSQSSRKDKPFVVVDCGGLAESLFESELFGHVKGSFAGATETKYGRFEVANDGTVFLDEIGNISMNIQTKLLRVLQEREITRVGSSQVIKVDVRIIAATNKELLKCVKEQTFREDLFYRLSVVPIVLPPLRERREDVPLLANHFLRKHNEKREKSVTAVSERAMKVLTEYDWPGNVRELENVVERAVVLTRSGVIEPDDLWYYELGSKTPSSSDADETRSLTDVEREHIIRTLEALSGHIGKASEVLGIDRKTLRLKLKKYGIG